LLSFRYLRTNKENDFFVVSFVDIVDFGEIFRQPTPLARYFGWIARLQAPVVNPPKVLEKKRSFKVTMSYIIQI